MFKIVDSKIIDDYENCIELFKSSQKKLEEENKDLKKQIEQYLEILEKVQPEGSYTQTNGCKRGPWCDACTYHETFHIRKRAFEWDTLKLCVKHLACEEFTPVKEDSEHVQMHII